MVKSACERVSPRLLGIMVFVLFGLVTLGTGARRLGAQISVSNTSLSGVVYDSSGAAIPGAR